MNPRILFLISLVFSGGVLAAQRSNPDSLKKTLAAIPAKESEIDKLLAQSNDLFFLNNIYAFLYAEKGLELSKKIGYTKGISYSYLLLAQHDTAVVPDFFECMRLAMDGYEKIKDSSGIADVYSRTGMRYWNKGKYPEAMEYLLKSTRVNESIGDSLGLSQNYNGLGLTFYMQKNYEKALYYHSLALDLREKMNFPAAIASSLNNMALIYQAQGKDSLALVNFYKCLEIFRSSTRSNKQATLYNNIAGAYARQKDYKTALAYHDSSLSILREIDDKGGMVHNFVSIGEIYLETGVYDKSLDMYLKALEYGNKTRIPQLLMDCYMGLSKAYAKKNDFMHSYEYLMMYTQLRDSVVNTENAMKVSELQGEYESEKAEKLRLLEDQKKELEHTAELEKRQLIIYYSTGGLLLFLIASVYIYRSYRQKQKANLEISRQKEIIEDKQKDILDSIRYAKRIQHSLLPSDKYIDKNLKRLSD